MPSASPWYASIAGRRVFTAPPAAAVPWSETALMRPKLTGSGIGARHAQGASTTSPAGAGRASPAAAGLGAVPVLHGLEPLEPADRPGAGPRRIRCAGHDGATAPRLG